MKPAAQQVQFQIAGTEVTVETGRIARQASGAALVSSGDNVLLATVVVGAAGEGTDFFPLTVEYREKFAAAGRIPGSFQRREGRISDHEILMSRLVDRTIRSLFPKGYRADVQLQVSVFSADPTADLSTLALIAGCAALHLSPAPAAGPAAGLRIVRRNGVFTAFPTEAVRAQAELDFVVSAGPDGLVMVEGGAREVDEATCVDALAQAQEWAAKVGRALQELRDAAGRAKDPAPLVPALPDVPPAARAALASALAIAGKQERHHSIDAARDVLIAEVGDDDDLDAVLAAFDKLRSKLVREQILGGGRRLDGRGTEDIRPIWTEVGWLPRTHGSSIFTRGETQALVTCTLGTAEEAQRVDGLGGLRDQHFLLHYNFPPYSVGEVRPLRGPGRREIGHGFLARRGLEAVLPSFDAFPYTIRIESEISESNGSSSMATACGGSLALMNAGVPIARPVAGIAMGLVTDGERTAVLSDILGDEDHLGDMDFKVVGTEVGVTALQLDNKVGGLTREQLAQALDQARRGRLHILGEMAKTLAAPNATVSTRAPQVVKTQIMPESVAVLIGPRGQTIKGIAAATGANVNVGDDGVVRIYAAQEAAARKALQMVGRTAGVVRRGGFYRGTISGARDFGVFVRLNEVTEGLVPREELFERSAEGRQQAEKTQFENGDEMVVRVIGVDDRGRLRLSRRAALGVDEALIEW
ncbi:MAG: polyribonucleotide nucleotidyltransferase [Planctomycetes bacterium]|nr:polyribonucleotide nucleotidyltransferase [Planctomycetota bacterium]